MKAPPEGVAGICRQCGRAWVLAPEDFRREELDSEFRKRDRWVPNLDPYGRGYCPACRDFPMVVPPEPRPEEVAAAAARPSEPSTEPWIEEMSKAFDEAHALLEEIRLHGNPLLAYYFRPPAETTLSVLERQAMEAAGEDEKPSGRAGGRPRVLVDDTTRAKVRVLHKLGKSLRTIAEQTKLSVHKVSDILSEDAADEASEDTT